MAKEKTLSQQLREIVGVEPDEIVDRGLNSFVARWGVTEAGLCESTIIVRDGLLTLAYGSVLTKFDAIRGLFPVSA